MPSISTLYDDYVFSMLQHIGEHRPTFKTCQFMNRHTIVENEHQKSDIVIEVQHEAVLRNDVGNDTTIPLSSVKKLESENKYYCHVPNLEEHLKNTHVIVESSLPNILGIDQSKLGGRYNEYLRRILYICPLLFATCHFEMGERDRDTLSILSEPAQDRAHPLLLHIKEIFPEHFYVTDCLYKDLQTLLTKSRILLAFHPTTRHDMLEEWNVLPALQCGTIVIAENSTLKELIPYQHMIIWVDAKDMVHTTEKVLAEYDVYHAQIFTEQNKKILEQMRIDNYLRLERRLLTMNFSLDDLAKHYKRDGDSSPHNYIPNYMTLFEKMRYRVHTVLEIGNDAVEMSKNMSCWRDYFCYADVLGICDTPIEFENKARVRSIVADVSNSVDMDKIVNKVGDLDIVIDSGMYDNNEEQRIATLCYVIKNIRQGGVYVMENVQTNQDMFKDLSILRDNSLRTYIHDNFDVTVLDGRPQGSHGGDDSMIAFVRTS